MHNKAPQNSATRKILSNPARQAFAPQTPGPKATPAAPAAPVESTSPAKPRGKDSVQSKPPKRKSVQPVQNSGQRGPEVADVLILGAGAAGLMCAREAASKGLSVVLLERGPVPGRKLAVSGGGKANFTNRAVSPKDYRCDGSRGNAFCAPALKGFTPEHMLRLVQEWNLPFEERTHGQLFLTVSAQRLVRALTDDCRKHGCVIACGTTVTAVEALADGFSVQTEGGSWHGKALVLALGSPAWPQAGGGGAGYRLAEELGHNIIAPRAVLAPLRLNSDSPLLDLTGISLPVGVTLGQHCWEDDLLFTHEGLSGPAALKASLYWAEGAAITLNFLPEQDVAALMDAPQAGKQTPRALLARLLPQRLVDTLLPEETARRKVAELSRAARVAIVEAVQRHAVTPQATAGLKKAEACSGGVNTDEVDPKTMRSLLQKNLFVVGELLDVTGLLGGYNLHWAWASGMAAARELARSATARAAAPATD
ncbi:aminoacetone oxidase family FAD-binding enzyme [Desulfovibrio desulfuricans]|uniref:NAD(P)/FAD-dependent oxidoreductase n=1 Tax=Desulfovibrio desulfuricans TaxID=876 RepID=UPI001782F19B|nr:aminoacetone oxidase family FAD-binding enzyme [Desulfovibrio desulfuricans]MBD8895134.1 aminoacetone oxidase family FAD-binding enzyme [Desulfovibrio desulfuricans]